MTISRQEVQRVSLLGRLLLSEQELDKMTVQLDGILRYMELLNEVDTSRVEPLAHPLEATDVFRDDQLQPSLTREEALANAPHQDGECYLVPAVLG